MTQALSLCGAALPPGLLGAIPDNPRGCFEPRAVIRLNQSMLHDHGSSGYDIALTPHNEGRFAAERNANWVAKVRDYFGSLPAVPVTVIKEPKTTAVSGIWFEGARQAGFDVGAIIAMRHPSEIIGSLAQRASRQNYVEASPELTCAWWLRYCLVGERDTRGVPRVFVEFSNLLQDWRREVKRISTALGVDLDARDGHAADEFLTPTLRHHRESGPLPEPFGTDWMSTVYETLTAAARSEPLDESALDRVYEAYGASERGFRQALDDSRRYRNVERFLPAPVVKLGLGTLALIHGRKGTWA